MQNLIALIDADIQRLQQARALLTSNPSATKQATRPQVSRKRVQKRILTPEGRKRISEAVSRRWAKQKAAAL